MDNNTITNKKAKITILIISLVVFVISIAGITYAYFATGIIGNEEASSMRTRSAKKTLTYNDVQFISDSDTLPGWTQTKTLTVTNTGRSDATYSIKWASIINSIQRNELVISATCTSSVQGNTCRGIPETPVTYATTALNDDLILWTIDIEPGEVHTYTVTVTFKNMDYNQDYNQRKSFKGLINIEDWVETDIDCFTTNSNGTGITGYTCADTDIVIPRVITRINANSLKNLGLTSVIIPPTVTRIDDNAFMDNSLTVAKIPDSVTLIGYSAFKNNQLTTILIPNSVTAIYDNAFNSNQLVSVVLSNGLDKISSSAFSYNQLISVTIPSGVTTIKSQALRNNQLESVIIPNTVTTIEANSFVNNQLTSLTIPDSVTTIGNSAFQYNNLTSLELPNSVTTIGSFAFDNNQIASLTIPNSVTTIGSNAFSVNQISSLVIPDSITTLENGTFSNNPLKSLDLGSGVTTIGKSFQYNQLSLIIIPSNVQSIATGAFYNSRTKVLRAVIIQGKDDSSDFTSIDISNSTWSWPSALTCTKNNTSNVTNGCIIWDGNSLLIADDFVYTVSGNNATVTRYIGESSDMVIPPVLNGKTVKTIGSTAFKGNALTSVVIPDTVSVIGYNSFEANNLTSVTIPDSVIIITDKAFYQNDIETLNLGNSVELIGNDCFHDNELTSVVIPNSVTSIGNAAFRTNHFSHVDIPSSVMEIGNYAFGNGNVVESVTIHGKSSTSDFTRYGNNPFNWASGVTCVTNNTSNVTNGCITWMGPGA